MTDLALALDGSTYSPSGALLRDGRLIGEFRIDARPPGDSSGRGEELVPRIAEMLEANSLRAIQITTVICGAGPGSFTSLRIAASVAKGIAFASGAKMYAVPSLLLTFGGAKADVEDGRYLAVLPAMRGELYALAVTVMNGIPAAKERTHRIVAEEALAALAQEHGARAIGPGQEMDAEPHARGAAALYPSVVAAGAIDLNSWEPDYGRLAEAQVKWEAAHGRPLRA
jgi:tRNA threonylcarbamoyladenosine biosynthesis protein TsaB